MRELRHCGWAALALVLAGCGGDDGSDGGDEPEPQTYPTCRYTNPFSMAAECTGYLGEGWTEAAITEDCARPFTGVVGELGEGVCAPEGAIGTCTEDPGGAMLLVTWFYGGPADSVRAACEGFAGGIWSEDARGPGGGGTPTGEVMGEALAAMASDGLVSVAPAGCADGSCLQKLVAERGALVFKAAGDTPEVGFILYPGAGVDPRAYAPAARAMALEGVLTALVPMQDGLAFNGVDRADDLMATEPAVQRWFVGGHSMGGVAAARYVRDRAPAVPVEGLVLWASFPSADDDLSGLALPVSAIFGSEDGLSTVGEIEGAEALLPADARYVELPGGNHGQFGYYGPQPGDGEALIDRGAQQQMVVASTLHFLRGVKAGAGPPHPGFEAAEALGPTWCSEAQRIVANVDVDALPDGVIDNQVLPDGRSFGESKASVDADADPALVITTRLRHAGNGSALHAPPVYAAEIWCKLKSQEALVAELGVAPLGGPQACAQVNRAALERALSLVSEAERSRFGSRGQSVSFAADEVFATGVAWLTEGRLQLRSEGGSLEVTSASLPVPLDAPAGAEFVGVYYCKLWSPADALRLVLE